MAMSSDDVNYLVYRYLLESGFSHSAFTFAHESLVARTVVSDSDIPPGALLSFLQKGLQYVEIESHLQEDGTERPCDEPFHLLSPHICRLRSAAGGQRKSAGAGADASDGGAGGAGGGAGAEFSSSDVTLLGGHRGEAYSVAWGPRSGGASGTLASGSSDGTARLWRWSERSPAGLVPCTVLRHSSSSKDKAGATPPEVSSLDWHPEGTRIATGANDGRVRVWSASGPSANTSGDVSGTLLSTLAGHTGSIFSVQWSPSGAYLLSGSADKSSIVWDVASGSVGQAFCFHTAPVLDVDWASDRMFASCSSDRSIALCTLGQDTPSRTFTGHTDEINSISWSPAKTLLASGSDDGTARLWSASGSGSGSDGGCVAVLSGHRKGVYSVKWAPCGEGSPNPDAAPLLATASYDSTVRLWDPSLASNASSSSSAGAGSRACKGVLSKHSAMVYALAWSPDGSLLASGASDKAVHIWSARDGSLVRSYTTGASGVFDVSFSADGTEVAAACANGTVTVLNLRR